METTTRCTNDNAEESKKFSDNVFSDFIYFRAMFLSAREQYEGGHLFKMRSLIQAEVFEDELEQAEHFLGLSYKVPVAVIAGTVLETTLRELCKRESVAIIAKNGDDITDKATLNPMNDSLAKQSVYNLTRKKEITGWADIRNNAAHGKPDEFDEPQVRNMIDGIRNFVSTHMC